MISTEEIRKQNLQDLSSLVTILWEMLSQKELTPADERRVRYCSKIARNVNQKEKELQKY